MFPKTMREKGTGVALANGSPMTKSIEFSISFRELECNYVFECAYISSGAWGLNYSLSTAVGNLIMSVTIGNLLMALLDG